MEEKKLRGSIRCIEDFEGYYIVRVYIAVAPGGPLTSVRLAMNSLNPFNLGQREPDGAISFVISQLCTSIEKAQEYAEKARERFAEIFPFEPMKVPS